MSGVARTNEPLTVGVPLPDSAGIASTNVLGLTGAAAAQFTVEGKWPDGNIKWVKVRAIVPSVSAGGTATITLTGSGSGNFGGANLATDNGPTITVSTGTAIFTIKKANFNVVDSVVMGSTTLVASGTSKGLAVLGPNPAATYPGNVTCLPTSGGSACNTVYSTANDGVNSTASIEENGPTMAIVNGQADLNDGAGHVYMHVTVRMYFSQNSSKVKLTTILRNADYGANNSNFATAYKGIQGFELRLTPSLAGTLKYTIANESATPTTGTLSGAGGTDYAYLYQAESTLMKVPGWCASGTNSQCVPFTPLAGYAIVANGSAVRTGSSSQYPQGWADISDAGGKGVEIGQYQFAAYGNKSLEFRGGGSDLRIGIWAAENNTTSTSTTTANAPYYIPYPQYSINDVYLNFHTTAPASLANDFLQQQHYLLAQAPVSWYNASGVFYYPLLDPAEETAFYTAAQATASPAVGAYAFADLGVTDTYNFPLSVWRYYSWPAPGASNQMELRLSRVFNTLRRGFTGGYLDSANFYKMVCELGFARADGFSWAGKPAAETEYFNYPTVTYNATNANRTLGMWNWVELGQEHAHWYGMPTFYFLSGDETIKDAILNGAKDQYLNTISTNNLISIGKITNARAAGTVLMSVSRLHDFFSTIGDSTTAAALLARGDTLWQTQIKPDLCVSGYPAGCTPDTGGTDTGANQRGTSKVRGVTFQWSDLSFNNTGCTGTPPANARTFTSFMTGILTQGLWEFRKEEGSGYADYNAVLDTAYGLTQAMFGEMYVDNGSTSWSGNGFRYKQTIDYPSSCGVDFAVQNPDAYWPAWYLRYQYLGQGPAGWAAKVTRDVQYVLGTGSHDELYHYTIGNLIYLMNHGNSYALNTLPLTSFKDNLNNTYTVSWTVPAGATSYRMKWGTRQIVDWIGFNATTYQFTGNPATTMNWFAATDVTGVPVPAGTTQSLTINTGVAGLTAANFMIKAYSGAGGITPPPAPPAVTLTAPAGGATVSGTVTVSAAASASAGVAGVQFILDGANLGGSVPGAGPSYSTPWDTTTKVNGVHVLSAAVTDMAGSTVLSGSISVTVGNTSAAPVITNVTATSITASSATITWATNAQADSQVAYGLTAAYGAVSPLAATLVASHSAAITGLAASTTYHFQALSRSSQGVLASSADFTFTTIASTQNNGSGTSIPLNTWTMVPAGGWPVEILNYDKSEYIASRKLHCIWGAYKQWLSSEHNDAIVCYSYAENKWLVLQNNGFWHGSHAPGVGHTVSVWAYMSDKDAIAFQTDGSGSNAPEEGIGLWWWYDVAGLSGQNREFSPRIWLGPQTPLVEALTYDPYDQKLMFYDKTGTIEVCDPNTNACTTPAIGGTAPPASLMSFNSVYNSTDHKIYIFGGGQADMYTLACNTNACSTLTGALLSVTCTGADCINGKPPARLAAGMAYSSVDKVFMMVGGLNSYASSTAFNDTWIFNPATLAWTERSVPNNYYTSGANFTADRLTYDQDSNTFILVSVNNYAPSVYAYPYSAALNYGRVSNSYTPPPGSLNRVQPTPASQSWVFDPAITASNGVVYAGWIETGAGTDTSICGETHHPYIQSSPNNGVWTGLPAGAQSAACLAIDPELSGSTNDSKLHMAVVNGSLWETHEKINGNQGYNSSAFARYWTGTSWTGGAVGCFSGTCGANLRQNPQALIAVGSIPTLAAIEQTHAIYTPEGYIYVAQWNGTAWVALGPKLNINGTGTQALDAAVATDGTNPAACWSEQVVAGDRATVTTTPQIQCSQWNGSSWARFGARSLNQNATSWASDATMTYVGGKFYIGWVERTTAGVNQLYVCRWDGSSCTVLGGGALNLSAATGWAAHPSLANDGTNVYVAWEEQAALGQHSMGYVKKWNGSSWSLVGGALNADPLNGSVEGITLTVVLGMPTAIWGELAYGSLRQAYVKQWNGSVWTALGGSGGPPPPVPTCDLNGDGKIDAVDVQIAINQALGLSPCNTADLLQNGQCSVVDVQRVINASLGGACLVGR
jgi:hypothetical protein